MPFVRQKKYFYTIFRTGEEAFFFPPEFEEKIKFYKFTEVLTFPSSGQNRLME